MSAPAVSLPQRTQILQSMRWIIETERLRLREFELTDAKVFFDLNADPEVTRHTGDNAFESIEESEQLIKNYSQYKQHGLGRWTVVSKISNEVLGWCGLKKHSEGFIDIGFRFLRNEWGKGYATEAAKACLEYGFTNLKLEEIIGRASQDNPASIRVLEKIGMEFWKIAPCEGIDNSVYYKINM